MVDPTASLRAFLVPVTQQTGSVTPVLGTISVSEAGLWAEPFDCFTNPGSLWQGSRKGSAGGCSRRGHTLPSADVTLDPLHREARTQPEA